MRHIWSINSCAAMGLLSLRGLTYQRRNAELRKAVKDLVISERLAQGVLEAGTAAQRRGIYPRGWSA